MATSEYTDAKVEEINEQIPPAIESDDQHLLLNEAIIAIKESLAKLQNGVSGSLVPGFTLIPSFSYIENGVAKYPPLSLTKVINNNNQWIDVHFSSATGTYYWDALTDVPVTTKYLKVKFVSSLGFIPFFPTEQANSLEIEIRAKHPQIDLVISNDEDMVYSGSVYGFTKGTTTAYPISKSVSHAIIPYEYDPISGTGVVFRLKARVVTAFDLDQPVWITNMTMFLVGYGE